MEDKIKQYLEAYRNGNTSLTSREIAKVIMRDIRMEFLPKMEESKPNALRHFCISEEEIENNYQCIHEYNGLNWGFCDCLDRVYRLFMPKLPEVKEGEFLEYKDGYGNWYKYTKELQDNYYFDPFDVRISKLN